MRFGRSLVALVLLILSAVSPALAADAPAGTLTIGVHVTLVNRWLDPGEVDGLITPFMVLYIIHDALVKPMPGNIMAPSLAESWSLSKDGLTYEFVIRKNAKFHNGDPVTADDVKFSFERYRGSGAKVLKDRMKDVQVVAPNRVRFVLKEPWPDFMAFYGTSATGAGWIVPKKYIAEAGYPNGFDGGDLTPLPPYTSLAEAVTNYLQPIGIRTRVRTMERAAFISSWREKKLRGLAIGATGAAGNAAARLEPFVTKTGVYAYGVAPELEDLYLRQAKELDRKQREGLLHQLQKAVADRVLTAPIFQQAFLCGVGPRVEESGAGLVQGFPYSAPAEDLKVKP
jgi:ABC-type transport system substrate-binding protein